MNIFVGNLAFTTTADDVRALFAACGTVDTTRMLTDRETGRSRGFGCVEMPDSRAAQRTIEALNGTSRGGRALTVNAARPREPRREDTTPPQEPSAQPEVKVKGMVPSGPVPWAGTRRRRRASRCR